jgi:hypothetical protein
MKKVPAHQGTHPFLAQHRSLGDQYMVHFREMVHVMDLRISLEAPGRNLLQLADARKIFASCR